MDEDDLKFFREILGENTFGGSFGFVNSSNYNMFCCEEAIIIAEFLRTKDKIIEFSKSDFKTQLEMIPILDKSHSNNTFTTSCNLAILYLPMLRDKTIDSIVKD